MSEEPLTPGVVVLHNIPRGFDERQMVRYFAQFGRVQKIRLSRSRKTGQPREYAYIQFECDEVAKIVASTMNNYLMFERLLKCEYVPPNKVHPKMFKTWNLKPVSTVIRHKSICNKSRSFENERALIKKRLNKIHGVEKKLAALGIDFKCVIVNDPKEGNNKTLEKIVVDSSDEDIAFKTPPFAVKVKKQKNKKSSSPGASLKQATLGKLATPVSSKVKTPQGAQTPKVKSPVAKIATPKLTKAKTPIKAKIPDVKAKSPEVKTQTPQVKKMNTPKQATPKQSIKTPKSKTPEQKPQTPKSGPKNVQKQQTPKQSVKTPEQKPQTPKNVQKTPKNSPKNSPKTPQNKTPVNESKPTELKVTTIKKRTKKVVTPPTRLMRSAVKKPKSPKLNVLRVV